MQIYAPQHIYINTLVSVAVEGSLRFITKQSNGTHVIWMRTGTQGNKWRFVDLSFANNEEPIQVLYEKM